MGLVLRREPVSRSRNPEMGLTKMHGCIRRTHPRISEVLRGLICEYFVALYALSLFIFAIVLLVSLVLTDKKLSRRIAPIEEAFFTFLYAMSCAWMLFILIDSSFQHKKLPMLKYRIMMLSRRRNSHPAIRRRKSRIPIAISRGRATAMSFRNFGRRSTVTRTFVPRRYKSELLNYAYMYNKIHPTGGLFIRTGLGFFCLGSAIHSSLKLIRNVYFDNCDELIGLLDNLFYIAFAFIQYFFLFKRSNLVINKMTALSHVGALHVVVTNFCVWIKQIIIETRQDIIHDNPECLAHRYSDTDNYTFFQASNISVPGGPPVAINETLKWSSTIMDKVDVIRQLVYPCCAEYSLTSMIMIFMVWSHIGKSSGIRLTSRSKSIFVIDCHSSINGFFAGIVVLILTILSLSIIAVSFDKNEHTSDMIIGLCSSTTMCLTILSLMGSLTVIYYMRTPKKQPKKKEELELYLLVISMMGSLTYCTFKFVPGLFHEFRTHKLFPIQFALNIIQLVECIVHGFLMFILLSYPKRNIISGNCRSIIMFLVICDLTMWLDENMAATHAYTSPFQMMLYKHLSWTLIKAFAAPLKIFFRFHCANCLSNAWKVHHHREKQSID